MCSFHVSLIMNRVKRLGISSSKVLLAALFEIDKIRILRDLDPTQGT